MYTITRNTTSGNFELTRNRDGRLMDSRPIDAAPIFYPMALHMSQQQPHATGHLWRAAELASEAGKVDLLRKGDRVRMEFDGYSFHMATVNDYEIRQHNREPEAVAAPRPAPIYTCDCDFYTKGEGTRPVIAGQPICKHILAGMMVRQSQIAADHWQAIAAKQAAPRTTAGRIRQSQEEQAEQMHEDAIISRARGKARRATLNEMQRQHEAGRYAAPASLAQQEEPF
jgi:hypothetical protein